MTTTTNSRSPSPAPAAPQTNTNSASSHRYAALQRLYKDALRSALSVNSYENFAACFPTPAKYCAPALQGVWKQLNNRLSEECLKDFEKICEEREIERGLATWEELIEDAKIRKAQAEEQGTQAANGTPLHLLGAQELYTAHLTPTLVKAEKELQVKLDGAQTANAEMMRKIEEQRAEMQNLVAQLERMVEDVEGAARVVEEDPMRQDLRRGFETSNGGQDQDVKMGG